MPDVPKGPAGDRPVFDAPSSPTAHADRPDIVDADRRRLLQASAALLSTAQLAGSVLPTDALAGGVGGGATVTADLNRYIAKLLKAHGCTTLFGVPGATCDALYDACEAEGFKIVVTASDLEAGYAADAYARRKGLAAVAVTYGVGTLSLANAIAGAYTERSPVMIFNGGPNTADVMGVSADAVAYSHSIGVPPAGSTPYTDLNVFKHITGFAESLQSSAAAPERIREGLLSALRTKRPSYIEINKSIWRTEITGRITPVAAEPPPTGSETATANAILAALRGANRPVVMLGIEVQRYGLAEKTEALVRKLGLPWTTTLLAKSVIPESTPGFVGVWDGPNAPQPTRGIVSGTDCLLALGCAFGRQYRDLVQALKRSPGKLIEARHGKVAILGRAPVACALPKLVDELATRPFQPNPSWAARPALAGLSFDDRRKSVPKPPGTPAGGAGGLGHADVMRAVDAMLDNSFIVIADTSLSMFPAASLNIRRRDGFLCNAVWQSIGYSVAASVGVAMAEPQLRPLVLCGDGGFQMTAQALSTLARRRLRAIVVVLDNASYAIEQYVIEKVRRVPPTSSSSYFSNPSVPLIPFLGLAEWDYAMLAKAMGFTFAETAATADELSGALTSAKSAQGPALIAVKVKKRDLPAELWPS